ncbi:MAG: C25 family cysteine peptidase, partial [Candidatus Promineifilaceae bacterium]
GKQNVNINTDVPLTSVLDGSNTFYLGMHTPAAVGSSSNAVYLNRITVDYTRLFIATNDELVFSDEVGGSREFHIDGYSDNNSNNILVWDITNPNQPQEVTGVGVTGSGPTYSYEFGTNHSAGATFIATTTDNVLAPAAISRYDVSDIEPSGNGADWVAIAYKDFITETQVLADHRADPQYGDFDTAVVDVEDVVNQYGYGLPIPGAIQDYMAHGLASWQIPPAYLLLVGDATIDPHEVTWNAPQYVMTDLAFVDRYQGQIPSDLVFSLLVGNDILPDLAVGRITAQTPDDMTAVVEKIITYDQNQFAPADWMNNFVFISDNTDEGGNFCLENQDVSAHIPDVFNKTILCLPQNPTTTDADNLRTELFNHVNVTGTLLVNYRGHGSINTWAASPVIMDQSYVSSWNNPTKPVVSLTGDCLDGFFAYPVLEGLGETFLRAADRGTAAHWSSSGLGLSMEHSVLVESLYDGMFQDGITALGDAANHAKIFFNMAGGHRSILYSFTLEGDPAMHLMRPDLTVEKTALDTTGEPGDTADFLLNVTNLGLYPSYVTVTDTLPADLNYVSYDSSVPATVSTIGNDVVFNLQFSSNPVDAGLPWIESAVITITTQVDNGASSGTVTNSAVVGGHGSDTTPGNNSDSALYDIFIAPVMDFLNYIPVIRKS